MLGNKRLLFPIAVLILLISIEAALSKTHATSAKKGSTLDKKGVAPVKKKETLVNTNATSANKGVTLNKKEATPVKKKIISKKKNATSAKKGATRPKNVVTLSKKDLILARKKARQSKKKATQAKKAATPAKKDVIRKETKEFFIQSMIESLQALRAEDRLKFLERCGKKIKCSNSSLQKLGIEFQDGIFQETKDRFWTSYTCFMLKTASKCPVDGGWTIWAEWEKCSGKCGGLAVSKRTRTCSNPVPRNFGYKCTGIEEDTQLCRGICNTKLERKSKRQLEALRFIQDVEKQYPVLKYMCMKQHCSYQSITMLNGKKLVKDKYWSSLHCYKYRRTCPVDGEWSSWGKWSTCSPRCGNGIKYRSRKCNNPAPVNGGYQCIGSFYQEHPCLGNHCKKKSAANMTTGPILSEWTEWNKCSVTCGKYGVAVKSRKCLDKKACKEKLNMDKEKIYMSKPCYNGACPTLVQWSTWITIAESSAVCGMGRLTRYRECNKDKAIEGGFCIGKTIDRIKNKGFCTDKYLKKFESWKELSATLKTDREKMEYDMPPNGDSRIEPFDESKEKLYTSWTEWSKCTKSCLTGFRMRFRDCKTEKGLACKGERWQTQPCNMRKCPVNGGWSHWERWTVCADTCEKNEKRFRFRKCDMPYAKFGGTCVGIHKEFQECQAKSNCKVIQERFGEWSSWSRCSKSCGTGEKLRTRKCLLQGTDEWNDVNSTKKSACDKSELETRSICNAKPCPTNGNWGNWNSWTRCNKDCGIGIHMRDRTCTAPAPLFNGLPCEGPGTDILTCFKMPCSGKVHQGIELEHGYLVYGPRGRPTGYFSMYLQFKPEKIHTSHLIQHKFHKCKSMKTCKMSLNITILGNKLNITVNATGDVQNMSTEANVIQKNEWHSLYLHLSNEKVFLRLNEGKKYEMKLNKDELKKLNYDGYTTIGRFTGKLTAVKINHQDYPLKLMKPTKKKKISMPINFGGEIKYLRFRKDSSDGIVGYSIFRKNSFIKIPIIKTKDMTVKIVFFPMSADGILLFNEGKVPGSYIYLVIVRGTLKFCTSDGKVRKCEDLMNLNLYQWYMAWFQIENHRALFSVNHGKLFQISFPNKMFTPVSHLCVGGGDKPKQVVFKRIIGSLDGFHGVIHELVLNEKRYNLHAKPIINDNSILSSWGLNTPERVIVKYKHQGTMIQLLCDYGKYLKKGVDTELHWLKEDVLLKLDEKTSVNKKLPGIGYISELTLKPSKNQTGLYACAIAQDGIFTITDVFILILHDVTFEYTTEELELMGLVIFMIVVVVLFTSCICCVVVYYLRSYKLKKLKEMKKVIVEEEFYGAILKDVEGNEIIVVPTKEEMSKMAEGSGGSDDEFETTMEVTDFDTTGRTDDLDTTGRTDDLDTTGRTDDLDTTGRTGDLDTTGRTEDSDESDSSDDLNTTGDLDTTGRTDELDTTGKTDDLDETDSSDSSDDLDTTGRTGDLDTTGRTDDLDDDGTILVHTKDEISYEEESVKEPKPRQTEGQYYESSSELMQDVPVLVKRMTYKPSESALLYKMPLCQRDKALKPLFTNLLENNEDISENYIRNTNRLSDMQIFTRYESGRRGGEMSPTRVDSKRSTNENENSPQQRFKQNESTYRLPNDGALPQPPPSWTEYQHESGPKDHQIRTRSSIISLPPTGSPPKQNHISSTIIAQSQSRPEGFQKDRHAMLSNSSSRNMSSAQHSLHYMPGPASNTQNQQSMMNTQSLRNMSSAQHSLHYMPGPASNTQNQQSMMNTQSLRNMSSAQHSLHYMPGPDSNTQNQQSMMNTQSLRNMSSAQHSLHYMPGPDSNTQNQQSMMNTQSFRNASSSKGSAMNNMMSSEHSPTVYGIERRSNMSNTSFRKYSSSITSLTNVMPSEPKFETFQDGAGSMTSYNDNLPMQSSSTRQSPQKSSASHVDTPSRASLKDLSSSAILPTDASSSKLHTDDRRSLTTIASLRNVVSPMSSSNNTKSSPTKSQVFPTKSVPSQGEIMMTSKASPDEKRVSPTKVYESQTDTSVTYASPSRTISSPIKSQVSSNKMSPSPTKSVEIYGENSRRSSTPTRTLPSPVKSPSKIKSSPTKRVPSPTDSVMTNTSTKRTIPSPRKSETPVGNGSSPTKPSESQIDWHSIKSVSSSLHRISPSKQSLLETKPTVAEIIHSSAMESASRTPYRTVQSPCSFVPTPMDFVPTSPRNTSTPIAFSEEEDRVVMSGASDGNIPRHSPLTIHHRSSSSNREPIYINSSEDSVQPKNLE